jgi:predicted nucleic acid-binding protein
MRSEGLGMHHYLFLIVTANKMALFMLKIYLDNCCYNRPFDDLTIERNRLEAEAKMFIQSLVKYGSLSLVYSYMSVTEINDSPFKDNKLQIMEFVDNYAAAFVTKSKRNEISKEAAEITLTGIKNKDAVHIACAIIACCDYFITTDKQILNYKSHKLNIVNPVAFVEGWVKIL